MFPVISDHENLTLQFCNNFAAFNIQEWSDGFFTFTPLERNGRDHEFRVLINAITGETEVEARLVEFEFDFGSAKEGMKLDFHDLYRP